jgi:hypothetical protein
LKALILLTISSVLAVSCGKHDVLRTNLRALADDNSASQSQADGLERRVYTLEQRVSKLESDHASAVSDISALSVSYDNLSAAQTATAAELDALDGAVDGLATSLNGTQVELADLIADVNSYVGQGTTAYNNLVSLINAQQAQINTANTTIGSIQSSANSTQMELTDLVEALDGESRVVSFLDPCGDAPGIYDEVLMVTNTGKVIAYFENGTKRHLAILTPNTGYQTTDAQACNFSVSATGTLN